MHLVISPHLDDGVLSCGPLISMWRRRGESVDVATIFSGLGDQLLSPAALEDRARYQGDPIEIRLTEDATAAQILDFGPIRLGLPELLYRRRSDGRPRVQSLADIFGTLEPCDSADVNTVAQSLVGVIEDRKPRSIYVPLGLGRHVDHLLVRQASEIAWRECGLPTPLKYYADVPYAFADSPLDALATSVEGVESEDVDRWIAATAAYATQTSIMFGGSPWQSRFRKWADDGNCARLFGCPS